MNLISKRQETEEKETQRVEAFSDGVFAIAITLLVLDLHVPLFNDEPLSSGLLAVLNREWPTFFAFITSFLTILVMWVNHHRMFKFIHKVDDTFLILNGLLLMGITLVPYPTSLLAHYFEARNADIASAIYSGLLIWVAVFYNLVWRYAAGSRRLVSSAVDQDALSKLTRIYQFGPAFYVVTFALSFVSVPVSFGLCNILAIYFAIPHRIVR